MTDISSVHDAMQYFNTDVTTTSRYEDMQKLDLPRNLNLQLEYERFDPETDSRLTAFPGRDTVVTSIKYSRKYKPIKNTEEKPGYANHYYDY